MLVVAVTHRAARLVAPMNTAEGPRKSARPSPLSESQVHCPCPLDSPRTSLDNEFQMVALRQYCAAGVGIVRIAHWLRCSERRLAETSRTWDTPPAAEESIPRIALFVDSLDHVSGVANAIRQWRTGAERHGRRLEVLCTGCSEPFAGAVHFPEQRVVRLKAYEGLDLKMPNARPVGEYLREGGFNICHICTPGPMGLLGLSAARELGLPVCGTYHTDFPRYVKHLIGRLAERPMSHYMRWFYGRMDRLIAPSQATVDQLGRDGFDVSRIRIVGRGVDSRTFSPAFRDSSLSATWGLDTNLNLLYVGRVSREKNLECLTEAFKALAAERSDVGLVIVGDGPYAPEMQEELEGTPSYFAGFQRGESLSRLYACCDLFVFPSVTDTFGNVVLEAQASGLPVVVSNVGGPQHAMISGETGSVVADITPGRLRDAVVRLLSDRKGLAQMGKRARAFALEQTREGCFEAFWNVHCECLAGRLQATPRPV